ncbi:MAG: hypothetical protein R3F65_23835 [bacterium]
MENDPPHRVARYLARAGLADPATVTITPGPSPLFDPLLTAPFAFYQAVPRGHAHAHDPPLCLMLDARTGAVRHRDPTAFADVAHVLDLARRPDRFTPDEWLVMAYVLHRGEAPTLAFGPADADPAVTAPRLDKHGDGSLALTGWTLHDHGRRATAHHITVAVDGTVAMT